VFDKVTVLYEGRQIYFGRIETAKQYFVDQGWNCLDRQTTADFLTAVTGILYFIWLTDCQIQRHDFLEPASRIQFPGLPLILSAFGEIPSNANSSSRKSTGTNGNIPRAEKRWMILLNP
jgi:hypothetical protein